MIKFSGKAKAVIESLIASLLIIILFVNYSNTISNESLERNQELLKELSLRSAKTLQDKIKSDQRFLIGIANNIKKEELLSSPQVANMLNVIAEQTDFNYILMITKDLKVYMNGEFHDAPADNKSLEQALTGETLVSRVFNSPIDQKLSTAIIVPTYDFDGQFMGMVCGIKHVEQWSNIIDYTSQYDEIYFHVIDEHGNLLVRSGNTNVIEKKQMLQEYFRQVLLEDKLSNLSGHGGKTDKKEGMTSIRFAGHTIYGDEESVVDKSRYISFAPVGINKWYVVALVPKEFVTSQSDRINNLSKILLLKVVGIFLLLIMLIARDMNNKTKSIALSKENYLLAAEKSDTIIFDYNIQQDIVYGSQQVKKSFGLTEDNALHIYDVCHKDDLDTFASFVQMFSEKKEEMSLECRLKYQDGKYKWNRLSLIPIFDAAGNLMDAMGILENITELKEVEGKLLQAEQQSKILQVQAERDHLTGLYNKGATEYLISNVLQESKNTDRLQAFIIMDLDNFKAINDNFGHSTGDEVLREVSRKLKEIFRNTDIVGRIGGDEFVVLLRDPIKLEVVTDKMKAISENLIFIYKKDEQEYKVSASSGMAIYPWHGESFLELYNQADKALYNIKRCGKGQFGICEE